MPRKKSVEKPAFSFSLGFKIVKKESIGKVKMINDTDRKAFYNLEVSESNASPEGYKLESTYGKIGSLGRTRTIFQASKEMCMFAMGKRTAEKYKKGYRVFN